MAAVFNSRSRKASASARGGRQEATMAMIPGVTAATKLWVDTSHCPHLPGNLSSLVLPRDPQPRVNNPGDMHDLPQTVASSHRSQLVTVGTPQTPQLCVSYSSLSLPQLSKPALISCYYHLLVSGWRTDTGEWPTSRGGHKTKAEH